MRHEASCSHLRVNYVTQKTENYFSGWWQCDSCPIRFAPAVPEEPRVEPKGKTIVGASPPCKALTTNATSCSCEECVEPSSKPSPPYFTYEEGDALRRRIDVLQSKQGALRKEESRAALEALALTLSSSKEEHEWRTALLDFLDYHFHGKRGMKDLLKFL